MNTQVIIDLVMSIVLGGAFGFGVAFFLFHQKKKKMKENILSDIENQEILDFQIPEVIDGKTVQTEVNLHELVGIDTEYEEDEDEEETEEDLDGLQDDFDNLGSEEGNEEAEEEVEPYVEGTDSIEPDEEYNDYVEKGEK